MGDGGGSATSGSAVAADGKVRRGALKFIPVWFPGVRGPVGIRWGGWVALLGVLWVLGGAAGCRTALDGLYALPLDHPPTEADWEQTPPFLVEAVGGRTSAPNDADVDTDAVHTSTASCHHGAEAPPVVVELRAFWADNRLHLRADWTDPTEDRGPVWTWTEDGWRAGGKWEDGLGVLWGPDGREFLCARYCHMEDWRMAGKRALAEFAMMTPAGEPQADFWVWRAGRGTVGGSVEDSVLGPEGRRGDGGGSGETYLPNSVRHGSGEAEWFGTDDAPRVHPAPGPGARAPGYLRAQVPPGRDEVEMWSRWEGGRWSVVLSRSLTPRDDSDRSFSPGREYAFGLAILDAVDRDHLAAVDPIRVRLVGPGELDRASEAVREWWQVGGQGGER